MGKNKVTRKQLLNEPDEFITFSEKAISFFKTRRTPVLVTAAVFFSLIIGIAAYRYLNTRWENAASQATYEVITQYQKALAGGQTPIEALNGIDTAATAVLDRYGRQSATRLCRLFVADAKLSAGNAADAISLYRAALESFEPGTLYHYRILESMAQAHIALKQFDEAGVVLQKVADGGQVGVADAALFQLGLVFTATGDPGRSDAAFRSLSEKYPDSQYAELIAARVKAGSGG